jgi:hypothetical protein
MAQWPEKIGVLEIAMALPITPQVFPFITKPIN